MALSVIVHATVSKEVVPAFRAAQLAALSRSRASDGCLRYDLFADVDDPRHFIFVQEWVSPEAYQDHFARGHVAELMTRWSPHWLSPPVIIATVT